jgi:probable blue pigment (indigoidine) exporter
MPRTDLLLTAAAPAVWGSTYLVTTELLPGLHPLVVALLRALPAGLLLLLVVRQLPRGVWWGRVLLLGVLNFSLFWFLLFVSAYRLPGGVAATVGAIQPLIVLLLGRLFLGSRIHPLAVVAGAAGIGGIALLTISPQAALDPLGMAAGLGGAVSMAFGTVLTRRWQPPVPLLTFTAWQLTAGGLALLPVALLVTPGLPALTGENLLGLAWLGLVGAAATYVLWFRGIARLGPATVAPLGLLSPVTAVILGWALLGQALGPWQFLGMAVVVGSVWLGQRVAARN